MKLYHLTPRNDLDKNNPWNPWYDACFGMVIRAKSELRARRVACVNAGSEGGAAWLDESLSNCVPLTDVGEEGLIESNTHYA